MKTCIKIKWLNLNDFFKFEYKWYKILKVLISEYNPRLYKDEKCWGEFGVEKTFLKFQAIITGLQL